MEAGSALVISPRPSILRELYEERRPRDRGYAFSRTLRTFLLLGGIYFLYVELGGVGFVCPFRLLTGLKCPGCGVTTMLRDLIRLDFLGAYQENPVLLFLLGPSLLLVLLLEWKGRESRTVQILCTILLSLVVALLLVWGVLRNIPGILG